MYFEGWGLNNVVKKNLAFLTHNFLNNVIKRKIELFGKEAQNNNT